MAQKRLGLLGLASAAMIAGSVVLAAAPVAAVVMPHVKVETFRAYNYPDSYGQVQHYNRTTSGPKYGPYVLKGVWSNQASCWAGVTASGYNFKA